MEQWEQFKTSIPDNLDEEIEKALFATFIAGMYSAVLTQAEIIEKEEEVAAKRMVSSFIKEIRYEAMLLTGETEEEVQK
jgi:hypothetical protein